MEHFFYVAHADTVFIKALSQMIAEFYSEMY